MTGPQDSHANRQACSYACRPTDVHEVDHGVRQCVWDQAAPEIVGPRSIAQATATRICAKPARVYPLLSFQIIKHYSPAFRDTEDKKSDVRLYRIEGPHVPLC